MKYHLPVQGKFSDELPAFMSKNNELIIPEKIYSNREYPSLPETMVKITGRNGIKILVPLHKISSMDV